MSIKQILATATKYGSATIYRQQGGAGYYAYVPYYNDKPRGPSTEIRNLNRSGLQAQIRGVQAGIALALAAEEFGLRGHEWSEDVESLAYKIVYDAGYYRVDDWRKEVRALIRKYRLAAA